MKPDSANVVEVHLRELEAKLGDIEQVMGEDVARPFRQLLRAYLTIIHVVQAKKASIGRLRRLLFGSRTERTRNVTGAQDASAESIGQSTEKAGSTTATRRRPNHGRTAANAYSGCERVVVTHKDLKAGGGCPSCLEGILYRLRDWALVIRLIGQPPVGGWRYELERLRCGTCGIVICAELPEEAGPNKYDPSVASVIANLRYGQGMPWNRIEKIQKEAGIPLPASVQWEQVHAGVGRGVGQVHQQLLWEAAQGDLVHNDDTHARILELSAKIKNDEPVHDQDPTRRGIFTSNVLSMAAGRPTISLFFTGAKHSGENLSDLLASRPAELPPPLQMCDALSRNMPAELRTIVANCLSHGRRNFCDVAAIFPAEVGHVLECLKEVYRIDAQAKQDNLSPDERLRLHQQQSAPVMDRLHAWLTLQLEERQVEPNAPLGHAIRYMLKHWSKLTLFLHVPGAPLDNNVCEQALKMSIRHRKNSLFYKTQLGARVGDIYMSIIHTCYHAVVDPVAYITALQRNHERVAKSPAAWLPWNYRQQLDAQPRHLDSG